MEGETHSSSCSHENPAERLWCSECDAPLPEDAPQTQAPIDATLVERVELYRKILDDLQDLSARQQIDGITCQSISAFYSAQLDRVSRVKADFEFSSARRLLISRVRRMAHANRLHEAGELLAEELARYPNDDQLGRVQQEIFERVRQKKLKLRAEAEAGRLLHEADRCLATLDYTEAIEKLQHALELFPTSRRITVELERAKRLLAEQETLSVVEATLVSGEAQTSVGGSQTPSSPVIKAPEQQVTPATTKTFAEAEDTPSPTQRFLETTSHWSSIFKPFLLDNVGWFVGAFLVIAGFVVLIVTFWTTIEQDQLLMHSLVFGCLFMATGMFFAAAYFMRLRYPQLESSSDVLLVIVALLIPLVFAAATLTALIPASEPLAAIALRQMVG